jgi:hypothetical protein
MMTPPSTRAVAAVVAPSALATSRDAAFTLAAAWPDVATAAMSNAPWLTTTSWTCSVAALA